MFEIVQSKRYLVYVNGIKFPLLLKKKKQYNIFYTHVQCMNTNMRVQAYECDSRFYEVR